MALTEVASLKETVKGMHAQVAGLRQRLLAAEERAVEADVIMNSMRETLAALQNRMNSNDNKIEEIEQKMDETEEDDGDDAKATADSSKRTLMKIFVNAAIDALEKNDQGGRQLLEISHSSLEWDYNLGFKSQENQLVTDKIKHHLTIPWSHLVIPEHVSIADMPKYENHPRTYEDIIKGIFERREQNHKLQIAQLRADLGQATVKDQKRLTSKTDEKMRAAVLSKVQTVSRRYKKIAKVLLTVASHSSPAGSVKRGKHQPIGARNTTLLMSSMLTLKCNVGEEDGRKVYIWPDLREVYSELVSILRIPLHTAYHYLRQYIEVWEGILSSPLPPGSRVQGPSPPMGKTLPAGKALEPAELFRPDKSNVEYTPQ